jgi:pimeloyl-ACP methyl ester carboxylesterase
MSDCERVHLAGMAGDLYGDPDDRRPPLILLHGLTFDRTIWGPAIADLRRRQPGRRILTLDLPGHGESAPQDHYVLPELTEQIDRARAEAGFDAPVIVGHSIAAVIASLYAARYPTCGVVNTDQTLDTAEFLQVVHGLADQLRGPAFPTIWAQFASGFHLDVLPPSARAVADGASRPDQSLVVGYWSEVLDRGPAFVDELVVDTTARLAAKGIPYLSVFGSDLQPGYEQWLTERIPQATFVSWPGSSHLPNLAHPDLFAEQLAATAGWPAVSVVAASSA